MFLMRIFAVIHKPSSVFVVIFLDLLSPTSSLRFWKRAGSPATIYNKLRVSHLAPGGVYSKQMLPFARVGSYPTFPSLPTIVGGLFLLHSSSNFFGKPLACAIALKCSDFPHRWAKKAKLARPLDHLIL